MLLVFFLCLVNNENLTVVIVIDRQGGNWGKRCWTTKRILCQAIYQNIDDEIKECYHSKSATHEHIKHLQIWKWLPYLFVIAGGFSDRHFKTFKYGTFRKSSVGFSA